MQQIWWFVKSKRAQTEDDYETWIEGEVTPTLNAFDLGDTRATTVILFEATRVGDVRVYEDQVMQTVIRRWGTGGGNVPYVFPIQDGREVEKKQNGLGVGEDGDPAYTIDTVSRQAIAAVDFYNQALTEKNQTLSAAASDASHYGGILNMEKMTIRRLTPTECERLQGFPDGWTEGQADSNRYKQMGNAVAVPVVDWIIKRLVEANANLSV